MITRKISVLDEIFTTLEAIEAEKDSRRVRLYHEWDRNIFRPIQRQVERRLSSRKTRRSISARRRPIYVNNMKDPMKRAESQKIIENRVKDKICAALGEEKIENALLDGRETLPARFWTRERFLSIPEGKGARISVPSELFRPILRRNFDGLNSDGVTPAGEVRVRNESDVRKPFPLPRFYFRNPILTT